MYAAAHAKEHPDQPVFVMGTSGETITFGYYEARCNQLAHLYRDLGLQRLDHVRSRRRISTPHSGQNPRRMCSAARSKSLTS